MLKLFLSYYKVKRSQRHLIFQQTSIWLESRQMCVFEDHDHRSSDYYDGPHTWLGPSYSTLWRYDRKSVVTFPLLDYYNAYFTYLATHLLYAVIHMIRAYQKGTSNRIDSQSDISYFICLIRYWRFSFRMEKFRA